MVWKLTATLQGHDLRVRFINWACLNPRRRSTNEESQKGKDAALTFYQELGVQVFFQQTRGRRALRQPILTYARQKVVTIEPSGRP